MNAIDLPLLLASKVARSGQQLFQLDRIRMQKAVFLFTQSGSADWRDFYAYTPYNWGPYSGALTRNVDLLMSAGRIQTEHVTGSQYPSYETTEVGEVHAQQVWGELSEPERTFVLAVRSYVTSKSFQKLLREVYAAFPQYATKSQFQG